MAAHDPRQLALLDTATTLHLLSRTPTNEAYWRGYLTGLRRRLMGGVTKGDMEYDAFQILLHGKGDVERALGRGFQDGLEGKAIEVGVG